MIDHLRIAEAQLRGRPRQSAIALGSVAVGTGMLLVTLAVTAGLSEDFIRKTTESSAHIEVLSRQPQSWRPDVLAAPGEEVFGLSRHHLPDEKRIVRGVAGVVQAVGEIPEVRLATPAVQAQVVLAHGTVRRPAVLLGVVPAEEAAMTSLVDRMEAGSWDALDRAGDAVILGRLLARSLGAELGAPLQAVGPSGSAVGLRVVGVVGSGLSNLDRTLALVNLPLAQSLAGLSRDQATTVRIAVKDPLAAPALARRVQERTGYVARSWQERSAASVEAFDRQNRITQVLVLFTSLVAALGVANVLGQMVSDKRRDIAILRAAGFSRHDIGIIYLHQGVLLGLAGGVLGWVLGAALIRVVGSIPVDFGEAALLRNQYLAMSERPEFYLGALAVAVLVCALAAVQPARRAARLEPTAILRGER